MKELAGEASRENRTSIQSRLYQLRAATIPELPLSYAARFYQYR